MNENNSGHYGLLCLGFAVFGKVVAWLSTAQALQSVGTVITIIGGALAATHYFLLVREKIIVLFKKNKKSS